jgi:hypothetical protein
MPWPPGPSPRKSDLCPACCAAAPSAVAEAAAVWLGESKAPRRQRWLHMAAAIQDVLVLPSGCCDAVGVAQIGHVDVESWSWCIMFVSAAHIDGQVSTWQNCGFRVMRLARCGCRVSCWLEVACQLFHREVGGVDGAVVV